MIISNNSYLILTVTVLKPVITDFIIHSCFGLSTIWFLWQGDWRTSMNAEGNGLVPGHAYTVTGVTKVKF